MNAFSISKPENGCSARRAPALFVLAILVSLGTLAGPAAWANEPSVIALLPTETPKLLPVDTNMPTAQAVPTPPKDEPREAPRDSYNPAKSNRQMLPGQTIRETSKPTTLRLLTTEQLEEHHDVQNQLRLLMGESSQEKHEDQNKTPSLVQGGNPPTGDWCFVGDASVQDTSTTINNLAWQLNVVQPNNAIRPEKIRTSSRVIATRYEGSSEHSHGVQRLLLGHVSKATTPTTQSSTPRTEPVASSSTDEQDRIPKASELLELLKNRPVQLAQAEKEIPRVLPSPHAMLPPDPTYDELRTSGRPGPYRRERREVPPPRLPPRHLPDEVIPGEQAVQSPPPANEYQQEEPSAVQPYDDLPYQSNTDWDNYPDLVPDQGVPCLQSRQCRQCVRCPVDPWGPKRLFRPRVLDCRDITLGGWVDQGISAVGRNPVDRYNGPVTFNDRCGEYQMNQLYMFVERKVCTGGCGLDFGGRLDVLYGTDARFVESVDGLEASWGQSERFYQLALPQFYLDVGINDVTVRMGHFYKIMGYEEVTAPSNFFYSHSYAFQYGEPKTQTGMLVFFNLEENLALTGGFSRGIDQFDDTDGRNQLAVLAAIDWTSCDGRKKVRFGIDSGEQGPDNITTIYSLVGELQVTNRLRWILEHNYGQSTGGNRAGIRKAEWYGLSQYVLYQLQDAWQAGIRIEWFCDEDGTRVRGLGEGNLATGPYQGNFYELTLGLNWQPHPNIMLRPEVRWDWYHRSTPTGVLPYDSGEKDRQFLYGFDLITQF